MASGRGELFGPGNAQLPAPPMLMFDRIVTINSDGGDHGKGYVEAELDINPELWFFQCHFIGDPVMPGLAPLQIPAERAEHLRIQFMFRRLDPFGQGLRRIA